MNEVIGFAHDDILTTELASLGTRAACVAPEETETHEGVCKVVECEEGLDVINMEKYFISSALPKQRMAVS